MCVGKFNNKINNNDKNIRKKELDEIDHCSYHSWSLHWFLPIDSQELTIAIHWAIGIFHKQSVVRLLGELIWKIPRWTDLHN